MQDDIQGQGQVEVVLDLLDDVPEPELYDEAGREQARVPFASDLVLTGPQEERLMEHLFSRLEKLESELGRDTCSSSDWWQDGENVDKVKQTHLGKRAMWEAIYQNNVSWRPFVLGGIFGKSNLVVPLARRITRQMTARANSYFFGSDPWFAAEPELGTAAAGKELAEKVDQFSKFKCREAGLRGHLEDGTEQAFVQGEVVYKTVYRKQEEWYQTTAEVLVNVEGDPILDATGGFIFQNDRWRHQVLVDTQTGEEEIQVDEPMVLERDGVTQQPPQMLWVKQRIRQKVTHFKGAETAPVYFKDFLCPLTAPSIDEADCICHLYDMPLMVLAETYREAEVLTPQEEKAREGESRWEATKRAVDLLRELSGNDGKPKSANNQRIDQDDSETPEQGQEDPVIEVVEFTAYFDADGDGIREHIFCVADRKTKRPIFYDHLANVTPDGRRNFKVERPGAVKGRWYGVGAMEMFETTQEIVDLLVNRWNHSMSDSGRVTFWKPSGVMEGDRDPNLKLNHGETYTLKQNFKPEDVLQYVTLPEIKAESIQALFEFFLQIAMNESGVQHANDAQMTGMDSAELATGVRNIEKAGMEMFSFYISKLEPGVEATLRQHINCLLANLDEPEVFDFFADDDPETAMLARIEPDEVRDLTVKIKVLLTRYKGEQQVQQAQAGISAIDSFYQKHPMVQQRTAPFYRMFIKALDLGVDADEVIAPLPAQMAPSGPGPDGESAMGAVQSPDNQPPPNL